MIYYIICYILYNYRQASNIRRRWIGNNIADHLEVVGASPVGAAPTTSSFSTWHLASTEWARARRETFMFRDLVLLILEVLRLVKFTTCRRRP